MPQTKTLEQVVHDYGVEDRPGGLYIGSINDTIPYPADGVNIGSYVEGVVNDRRRRAPRPAAPNDISTSSWGPVAGQARDAALDALEKMGINPASPVSSVARQGLDIGKAMLPSWGDLPAATGAALGTAATAAFPPAIPFGAGAGAAGGEAIKQLVQRLMGSPNTPSTGTEAAERIAGQGLGWGTASAIPGLAQTHALNPISPSEIASQLFKRPSETLMTRALSPSDKTFQARLPTILDQLKEAEAVLGPLDSVEKVQAAENRQFRVNENQYRTEIIEPQKDIVVPGSRASDKKAQIEAIPDSLRLTEPKEYQAIVKDIQEQPNKDFTIGELDTLRSDLAKGRSSSFLKKLSGQLQEDPTAKAITAARSSNVTAIFYDSLDRYGRGGSAEARELNDRIGALIHLRDAADPRLNPSIGQARPPFQKAIRDVIRTSGDYATGGQLERFQNSLTNRDINSDIASAMKRWNRTPEPVIVRLRPKPGGGEAPLP